MKTGAELIAEERARQVAEEGYDAEHDANHEHGELVSAAIAYGLIHTNWPLPGAMRLCGAFWPWDDEYWKPQTPTRDLVRAGALIAAEIDRRQYAAGRRAQSAERGPERKIITPPGFGEGR